MGINKGSLYNAFGSKKELFKEVLTKFVRDNQGPLLAQLSALDDPIAAIAAVFDGVVAQGLTDFEKKGNLIINTALEMPNHDEDVQEIVRGALDNLEEFFLALVQRGKDQGRIPETIVAEDAARSLVSLTVGIRVLARGAFDGNQMLSIKANALRLVGN
jgi:TetR/AcrR family transcriptional repressor of nem operon